MRTTSLPAFLATALLVVADPLSASAFFMCARGSRVLAGNNEDYTDPDTIMWFESRSRRRMMADV